MAALDDPLVCSGFPSVLLNWKNCLSSNYVGFFNESEFSNGTADLGLAAVLSGDHMVISRGGCFRKTRNQSRHPSVSNPRSGPEELGLRHIHLHGNRGVDQPLGMGLLEKRWSLVAEQTKEVRADVCSEPWQTEMYLRI